MAICFGEWTIGLTGEGVPDRKLIGGKAWSVARMQALGLNVPPAIVITTRACAAFIGGHATPPGLEDEIAAGVAWLEERTGRRFGGGPRPLLVSVRSGAPVSMPGMMDTVLNLGLNRAAALAIAAAAGDARFMADLLVRFGRMYGEIVLGALEPGEDLDALVDAIGPGDDPGQVYDTLWAACQQALAADTGETVPDDPGEQLTRAVQAVFRSWNSRRARTYRDFHHIAH